MRLIKNTKRKIFFLHKKQSNKVDFYGSLTAVFNDNTDLGISKYTLDRWDFSKPFENDKFILTKSFFKTSANTKTVFAELSNKTTIKQKIKTTKKQKNTSV